VKVQFHWDRDGKFNENSSCWVRVAQLWTGGRFGSLHIPRVGQEVVVEFLDGNPDRPLITGCVYNAKNMPPYDLPANQTQTGIKTRSSPGANPSQFNELRFEDKVGAELVSLHAQKDLSETIKNDHHTGVGGNQTTNVAGSRSISIQGETSLEGILGSKLSISGDYLVDVTKSITLKCGSSSILITPDRIVLTACGGAWLALDENVSTHGAQVDVSADVSAAISGGTGSVTSDASGVTVSGPMIKLN
jgi:type VI secretion system secreted protein VgrG